MCLVNTRKIHIKIISINLKDGEKKYDREMPPILFYVYQGFFHI